MHALERAIFREKPHTLGLSSGFFRSMLLIRLRLKLKMSNNIRIIVIPGNTIPITLGLTMPQNIL